MKLQHPRYLGNEAAMAAYGECCRRCGHVLTARFDDPKQANASQNGAPFNFALFVC
jgi:hypothetical protein